MAKKPAKPGYGGSGESPTAAEITVTEYFFGTGLNGQVLTLSSDPLEPIVVEVWNATKEIFEVVDEADYVVTGRTITLDATKSYTAAASAAQSDRNVKVHYEVNPGSFGGNPSGLYAENDATSYLELRAAAPLGYSNFSFSPATGKGKINQIRIVRMANAGTAYTANSRRVEIHECFYNGGAPPTPDADTTIYRTADNLEPSAGGTLLNTSDVVFGDITVINLDATYQGYISVAITALGGAADSEEDYYIKITGEELI